MPFLETLSNSALDRMARHNALDAPARDPIALSACGSLEAAQTCAAGVLWRDASAQRYTIAGKRLLTYAFRLLRDADLAEDAVHVVFAVPHAAPLLTCGNVRIMYRVFR